MEKRPQLPVLTIILALITIATPVLITADAADYAHVYDDTGKLQDTQAGKINTIIENGISNVGPIVKLHITDRKFDNNDDFSNHGRVLFYEGGLDKGTYPHLNTLILVGKIKGEQHIGYFHSYSCGIFARRMKQFISSAVSRNPEDKDFYMTVVDVYKEIIFALDISGDECILNICEIINSGDDERYGKAFEGSCEKMGNNGKDYKSPHKCSTSGRMIKCLYKEAYSVQDADSGTEKKNVYIISDDDWKSALSVFPLAVYHEKLSEGNTKLNYNPYLLYHKEDENSVDTDSLLILLEQMKNLNDYEIDNIIILDEKREDIPGNLLISLTDEILGAGFSEEKVSFFDVNDIHKLWKD